MTQSKSEEAKRKAERLAAKLRENLKRRKAQARARDAGAGAGGAKDEDGQMPDESGLNGGSESDS